jgi:hypothetical protein
MKKIAIKFIFEDNEYPDNLKSTAQELQRFIIDDDYQISTIMQKIRAGEMIILDIGMKDPMPLFEDAVDGFDEEGLNYLLYKQSPEGWQEVQYKALSTELDRTPKWLISLVAFNLLWLVVMSAVQLFPIYKFYDEKYEMGTLLTLASSAITGIVPILSSVIAYFGATEFYGWESSSALFAFFGYYLPLMVFILYLIWLILKGFYSDRWYRFWRSEFN